MRLFFFNDYKNIFMEFSEFEFGFKNRMFCVFLGPLWAGGLTSVGLHQSN